MMKGGRGPTKYLLVSQASPPYEKIEKGPGQKPLSRVSQRNVFGYAMIALLVCGF